MLSDEEISLVERIKSGDENAFRQVYVLHFRSLAKVAVDLSGETLHAKDAVQNAFIHFWNKRESLQIRIGLYPYLRRMVIHEILGMKRKSERRAMLWQRGPAIQTQHSDPEDALRQQEADRAVHRAIDALPERCAEIFRLSRFSDMTYPEIAEALDLSVKTVENQMGKALRVLRETLKDDLSGS